MFKAASLSSTLLALVLAAVVLAAATISTISTTMVAAAVTTFRPLSTAAPPYPSVTHPQPPSSFWASSIQRPYPTNAWFMNAVLGTGEQPIVPYPYAVSLKSNAASTANTNFGCMVSLPAKTATQALVLTTFLPNMLMTSTSALQPHRVTRYDRLGVDIMFAQSGGAGTLTFPLMRGSPYITGIYQGLTPRLSTSNAILSVNGGTTPGTVTASTLLLTLNNGQTMVVYLDRSATWTWTVNGITVQSSTAQNWVMRLAILPGGVSTAVSKATLDQYAGCVPMTGRVDYDVQEAYVDQTFTWTTLASSPVCSPLIFVLPHQTERLQQPSTPAPGIAMRYDSVKGTLSPIVGISLTIRLTTVPLSFEAPRPVPSAYVSTLRTQLLADATVALNDLADSYTFGKLASKMARLALIADELGETTTAANLRTQLRTRLGAWLARTNADKFLYDASWGGVITQNGFNDRNAEYGQGWYNDHHFHFGYFVYAIAATIRPRDATALQWMNTYRENILALVRDFANPSSDDTYFVPFRNQDAWDGHSWAAGLFEFGDSRNQESSSESLNAYYAVSLLGEVMDDGNLLKLGRVTLATEMAGVLRYWHMTSTSSVYPAVYSANKCVGMVWGMKIVDATWFASGAIYVHGINLLPYTPLSEYYLPLDWATEEYPVISGSVSSSNPAPDQGWLGFMYGVQAVINPTQALQSIAGLTGFDNGNTRTNMLYWTYTRPQLACTA